jgi:TonB family protein
MRILLYFAATLLALVPLAAQSTDENVKLVRMTTLPASMILSKQQPVYPPDALDHRIQGVVKVAITIGKDGQVERAHLVSGHRLLAPAALQAVRRWTFQPTESHGEKVRVATQIAFSFTLAANGGGVVENVWPAL